jgi:hypothetical protein
VLTVAQRAGILEFAAKSDLDPSTSTDEDIWYGFLSVLFGEGMTLKDLKLNPAQRPEIMACLRQSPSVAPRRFDKSRDGFVRSSPVAPEGSPPDKA